MKSQINHLHSTTTAATNNIHSATTSLKEDRMKQQSSITLKLAVFFAMIVTLALSATPAFAQANPNLNPNQIAILRWYQANTSPQTFSMGGSHASTSPVAFDGENIWVASTDGYLAEFSTDGKLLFGPFALPNGTYPVGMAFDGSNVWITDFDNNRIEKFNVNSRTLVGSYNVGRNPYFIAFDGINLWVANNGDATVAAYKASTGALAKGPYSTRGTSPTGVAFDGKCIWVSNTDSNTVSIFDPGIAGSSCSLNGMTTSVPVSQPFGLAYDGKAMWVSYRGASGTGAPGIVELNATTGAYVGNFGGCGTSGGAGTIVFDGAYIWQAANANGVCKYKSSWFTPPLGYLAKYSAGGSAGQVAFDGANIWSSIGGASVAKF